MQLTLSVTDQSPMRRGEPPASALRDTVLLAQAAERLGYERYWVAEHHNTGTYAGTSPEILVGQLLANTSRIRVGSGGVMLSHYSALKVAEQFSVLDSFYPGRVDLGIGRAPGSDHTTMFALAYPKRPADIETFPQQVVDLIGYLHSGLQPDHPFAAVKARPGPPAGSAPEVWLLGSSDYSANLAAYIGLPFAFADFFGHTGKHGPAVAELYRRNFRPSPLCPEPRVNVTAQVVCAPTEEEARFLASSRNLNRARRAIQAQTGEQMQGLVPAGGGVAGRPQPRGDGLRRAVHRGLHRRRPRAGEGGAARDGGALRDDGRGRRHHHLPPGGPHPLLRARRPRVRAPGDPCLAAACPVPSPLMGEG